MYSLCYVSAASHRASEGELLELLRSCQKNNNAINVTGMLLYNGQGTFIQVLEGEQNIVEGLYEKIKKDKRHARVNCIAQKAIETRGFPNWSMGFKVLDKESLTSIDGFSDFMNSGDATAFVEKHTGFALELLSHFKHTSTTRH